MKINRKKKCLVKDTKQKEAMEESRLCFFWSRVDIKVALFDVNRAKKKKTNYTSNAGKLSSLTNQQKFEVLQ